ncbi:MAG TPA: spermidine/putrescine ABC transporter substrate-binding protein [Marmoricola sp.]|nr:spermidine/putrescine ABC transporter substrate-binding protein [Marmoricola sp.]
MSPLSRRTLIRGAGGAAFIGGSAAVLPLFGLDGAKQNPLDCMAKDLSATQKQLQVSNWPQYIDPIKKASSTLKEFEKRTGIAVTYTDDVNDNTEFFAKVRNQLGSCQPIKRDIMILTDWMAGRMVGLGWVQPIDPAKVPNLHKNLIKPLQGRSWDPERKYSAPWQSGVTGMAYNAAKVGEVRSFKELLTRSDLKGRVTLLSEMRDTMGFMLRVVGADPANFNDTEWGNALEELRKSVVNGHVRAFTGNDYSQDLAAGNILACEAWCGDVIQLQFDNPDIKFVYPEEGTSLWSDNMLIPNLATHHSNAEEWINYYYEPEVAAKLAAWNNYICPVEGGKQAMEKLDPSLVDNKLIFPDESDLKTAFEFMTLNETQNKIYEKEWSDVTGG